MYAHALVRPYLSINMHWIQVIYDYSYIRLVQIWPLTLKVLVATTDAQWEGRGMTPCPTIRILSYSN